MWFSGFTPSLATTVWMGFDQPKSLGTNEFGSGLALSTWLDYMQPALKGVPEAKPAPRPDGLIVDNGEYYFSEFPPGQAVASLDLSSGDALTDFLNNNRSTDGVDTSVKPLPPGGGALGKLASIDTHGLDPRLAQIRIDIASDVDNPLCGPQGASHVFGPQKGATPEQVLILDQMLTNFADVCAKHLGSDHRDHPGAGAAGGLGFAAKAFLGASFRPGVEIVAELGGLARAVEGATLVFTGEGRMDAQTLRGKTPAGVAKIALRAGVPVVALAGSLGEGYEALHACGISAAFSLAPGPITLQQALTDAEKLLADRARDVMQLWMTAQKRML